MIMQVCVWTVWTCPYQYFDKADSSLPMFTIHLMHVTPGRWNTQDLRTCSLAAHRENNTNRSGAVGSVICTPAHAFSALIGWAGQHHPPASSSMGGLFQWLQAFFPTNSLTHSMNWCQFLTADWSKCGLGKLPQRKGRVYSTNTVHTMLWWGVKHLAVLWQSL